MTSPSLPTRPFRRQVPLLPLPWIRPRSAASTHGSRGRPAGPESPAPSAGRAPGRGAGPLGRGLVVGPAGAERLRVPPAAGRQHAARAARRGARSRSRPPPRRPPRPAAAAPRGPRRGGQGQAPARTHHRARAAAGAGPRLGRPHSFGNPAADFRAPGGGGRAHALPRQGRARVPPLARGRLPARSLAHRDPVAPAGRPIHQRRRQGREEAPGFPGVAYAQSVLTAPEADPHPLEVPGTSRAEGGVHGCGELLGGGGASNAQAVADLRLPDHCHLGRPAGWLLPPAPALGGEHWHSPEQHAPPAAPGGPAERLPPAAGTRRPTSPAWHAPPHLQPGPCPQVLRLLNLIWLPKPAGRAATPGPGFPRLEELCLAGSTCSFVSDEALSRLLRGSPGLRLLDLRGCARVTPVGLAGAAVPGPVRRVRPADTRQGGQPPADP
ncbi:F-box/LRR-repeat protein 6 isoform X3 [Pipistrellus kuhlii]|uniref:F-box/LRR-repeat protein 6 isoform X3 n=1 Tax=Pipistrellus kuhlii TaxID=59472 RepID=UPI001E270F4E|nr:F-box/LRR-repeat protein 6 isoform X3 [Pipistrellus kuhlii]